MFSICKQGSFDFDRYFKDIKKINFSGRSFNDKEIVFKNEIYMLELLLKNNLYKTEFFKHYPYMTLLILRDCYKVVQSSQGLSQVSNNTLRELITSNDLILMLNQDPDSLWNMNATFGDAYQVSSTTTYIIDGDDFKSLVGVNNVLEIKMVNHFGLSVNYKNKNILKEKMNRAFGLDKYEQT